MTIMKIMIDERDISVCIVNGEHEFKALTKNLLENITKKQIEISLSSIIIFNMVIFYIQYIVVFLYALSCLYIYTLLITKLVQNLKLLKIPLWFTIHRTTLTRNLVINVNVLKQHYSIGYMG